MSLGLQRVGFDVVQAYDIWEPALRAYRKNVGPHAWAADLKNIFEVAPMISALSPDLICGGPPCQDFSAAGPRQEGERAGLTNAFAMIVSICRPTWFMLENVARASKSMAWLRAREMLVHAGYGLTEATIDASFYGVPQRRKRLIVIGRLGEEHGFLSSSLAAARSERAMTVRDMLGDALGDVFYAHPRMPGKRGYWSTDDAAPTMRSSSRRPEPLGRNRHPTDHALLEAGAYFTRPFHTGRGVRTLDEPAAAVIRTSRERPRPAYLAAPHPLDPVPVQHAAILSQGHMSRIQGFPMDWDWSGATVRDVDQMIANAVPPAMAARLGQIILDRSAGLTIPEIHGRFGQWLRSNKQYSKAAVRNTKTRINRARRLLLGRTFQDAHVEAGALEGNPTFQMLPSGTRTDLRTALRLYREWSVASERESSRAQSDCRVRRTTA